jgi:hypothetical protein
MCPSSAFHRPAAVRSTRKKVAHHPISFLFLVVVQLSKFYSFPMHLIFHALSCTILRLL